MTRLHVLRVFVGPDGRGGNPLGVFLEGSSVPHDQRLPIAGALGYSETVYVDRIDADGARIAIFTPSRELPFAGHPTVGTSWLLRHGGAVVDRLIVPAGVVETWQVDELAWIRARASWVHPMNFVQYDDAIKIERMTNAPEDDGSYYAWAWVDEAAGTIRSRYFAAGYGIREDEATGAAAVVMGDKLGRALTIKQGVGSELHVRPGAGGTVEVGGRVLLDDVRDYG